MSHEMQAQNNNETDIAYLRFTMGDPAAHLLYELLDANEYNGGVSGTFETASISLLQMEKAIKEYRSIQNEEFISKADEYTKRRNDEIVHFLQECLATAEKEEEVHIHFY